MMSCEAYLLGFGFGFSRHTSFRRRRHHTGCTIISRLRAAILAPTTHRLTPVIALIATIPRAGTPPHARFHTLFRDVA